MSTLDKLVIEALYYASLTLGYILFISLGLILFCLFMYGIGSFFKFFVWYRFKHLFPKWQWSEEEYCECHKIYQNSEKLPTEDWRKDSKLFRKGRKVILYLPHEHFGRRKYYILIKRKKEK